MLSLPSLPAWAQQLAGIVPLSALVEFVDVSLKLHIFELSGAVPLWNWPISPAGARLLLAEQDAFDPCWLDRIDQSPVLHCIDGRFGDWYPSSAPTTARLCASVPKAEIYIPNQSSHIADDCNRKQQLRVLYCSQLPARPVTHRGPKCCATFSWTFLISLTTFPLKYKITSAVGWISWTGLALIGLSAGCYVATAFLLLMIMTGIAVCITHGGKPRKLLDHAQSSHNRVVVATGSVNGSSWLAFFGRSSTVNAILNKPLYRTSRTPYPRIWRIVTKLVIIGQWVLAVASCALQDWNAFIIAVWIVLCAAASAYGYPAEDGAQDWLARNCYIEVYQVRAEFSCRRSMLTALLHLNPDSREKRTSWINPILANSADRRAWEDAVLAIVNQGVDTRSEKPEWWWKFVDEGLEMGRKIQESLASLQSEQ